MKNIFVGNLNFDTSESELKAEFEQYGEVDGVRIITDRETGRPRGFGFVEMPDAEEAATAIAKSNGKELAGRRLNVSEALPKVPRNTSASGVYGGDTGFKRHA